MHVLSKYFKSDGESKILYTGEELEMYIPDYFTQKGLVNIIGEMYEVFGVLDVKCINNGRVETGTLNIPMFNYFYPKEVTTGVDSKGEKVKIMHFYKDSVVMNKAIKKDTTNCEMILKLIMGAKLPNTIPYGKLLKVWDTNLQANGMNYKVASVVKEIILMELYKDKTLSQRYAAIKGKNPNASEFDYRAMSVDDICSTSSTFSALTYEDMDKMIIESINMKQYNKQQKESPLEKLIKM